MYIYFSQLMLTRLIRKRSCYDWIMKRGGLSEVKEFTSLWKTIYTFWSNFGIMLLNISSSEEHSIMKRFWESAEIQVCKEQGWKSIFWFPWYSGPQVAMHEDHAWSCTGWGCISATRKGSVHIYQLFLFRVAGICWSWFHLAASTTSTPQTLNNFHPHFQDVYELRRAQTSLFLETWCQH